MTRERRLRRQCRRLLRELDIRPPLDTPELCRRLGAHRGRPIRLMPYPIEAPGPFGLWLMTDSADIVFYQQDTTRAHQDHIILHEVGHIIADHKDEQVWTPGDDPAAGLLPGGLPRGLPRTCYDSRHEREAELIATIILERASFSDQLRGTDAAAPAEDPSLVRIEHALAHRSSWL